MLFVHNRQPEWEREWERKSASSLCLDSSRQQKASCCCCCPTLSSPFSPLHFPLAPFLLPLLFWLSYFVLSRCLHDTPLWWSKVSHSDPLCSPGCSSQQRTLSPPSLPPLSHSFAYHINSSGCLFFLSIVYFLVSVFSALLSDPEHSKKAKKSKNVDLLLLLFQCRLLLKA